MALVTQPVKQSVEMEEKSTSNSVMMVILKIMMDAVLLAKYRKIGPALEVLQSNQAYALTRYQINQKYK